MVKIDPVARAYLWGPGHADIQFALTEQVPMLNEARAQAMKSNRVNPEFAAYARHRALQVAQDAGRIEQTIRASEDLRMAAWQGVWCVHQSTAWEVSWILANLGIALATYDLIDEGYYTMDDYLSLIAPWMAGFTDIEIPR